MKAFNLSTARDEFASARRRAAMQKAIATLTGKSIALLPYEEVREKLKFSGSAGRGIHEIPLADIVGSVGRYQDFTRSFLPTNPSDEMRWAGLRTYMEKGSYPPIDVYQLGDAYFVIDGNHRVSIAKILGHAYISAYVTEVKTRVPFSQTDTPNQLICKSLYAQFLEQTNIDTLLPDSNLLLTMCDQYDLLLSQIEVHRYFMWLEHDREYPQDEVATGWYAQSYLPIVQIIREQGLLSLFPERTEADMYILLTEHRLELEKQLGSQVDPPQAAADLTSVKNTHGIKSLIFKIKKLFGK